MSDKIKVLIAGTFGFGPLERHTWSFLKLLDSQNVEFYFDFVHVYNDSKELLAKLLDKGNCFISSNLSFDYQYDFAIFTSDIGFEFVDCNRKASAYSWLNFKERNAKIKICYPVWDGTILPTNWVDIINNDFDICITPSRACAHDAKRNGVTIDCFSLHCLVLNEELLTLKPRTDRKRFRFGAVGISDFRKNIHLLIEAFAKQFENNDNVELYLHIKPCEDVVYTKYFQDAYKKYKDKCNIILSNSYVSHEEMIKIISSFDAYVFPQTVTGYFTTLAEAFSIGLPVIASDIPAHIEILDYIEEKNNIFWIKHNILEPAYHWVFAYMSLGAKFNTTVDKIAEQMKNLYDNRDKLYTPELIEQRKKAGKCVSITGLQPTWNQLVNPVNIVVNNNNQDINGDVFFMSERLLNKYKTIGFIKDNLKVISQDQTSLKPRYQKYWYEDLEEFKNLEKFSLSHQELILQLLKNQKPSERTMLYLRKIRRILLKLVIGRKKYKILKENRVFLPKNLPKK